MENRNFSKGDRVRICWETNTHFRSQLKGKEAIVVHVVQGKYTVQLLGGERICCVEAQHLELISRSDRRMAFLTRLQSLLREYDVEIHGGGTYYVSFEIDANSRNRQEINYPLYDMDKYWIDADNIMDFDKE